jgi:L-iditol 2-dehydrogenase
MFNNIPTMMKTAVLADKGKIEIVSNPVPQPNAGEVLVKLKAVGICGSDVHYFADGRIGDAVCDFPFVLGHEPSGQVVALGPGIIHLKVGDRVALEPADSCGICYLCQTGRPNCCASVKFLGSPPIAGVYEEYHVFKEHLCVPIPDNVSYEIAALLEPLAVGIHAVDMSNMKMGSRIFIAGCGPIGLLTAVSARAAGASFIAMTDPIPERRALALKLGADMVIDPAEKNAKEKIISAAEMIDIAFEAVGVQDSIDDATLIVRPGGTVVIIGIPTVDRISLYPHPLRRKELNIIMSRRSNFNLEPAIRLLAAGTFDLSAIITHKYAIDELGEAMKKVHNYQDGVNKAMIIFD